MIYYCVTILSVLSLTCSVFGSIPEPTAFGTIPCKKWPEFELQDYNPASSKTYLQSYGLGDMPKAAVTIVGLYFADSEESQDAILYQARAGYALRDKYKLAINNVAINFYAPKKCAEVDCGANSWWSVDCSKYIGGCPLDDEKLEVDNWQHKLTNITGIPILQDSYWVDAWERFGGGEGDVFIYDSEGRLYSIFCTKENSYFMPRCANIIKGGGLMGEASYLDLKNTIYAAAKSDPEKRCGQFDDDYYGGYRDQYYYYYYGDDKASDDDNDGDDDDDDDGDDDDDNSPLDDDGGEKKKRMPVDYAGEFHLGYRTDIHDDDNTKSHSIPLMAYASVIAISILLISAIVGYFRWTKRQQRGYMSTSGHSGSTQFTRLPTTDEDSYGSL